MSVLVRGVEMPKSCYYCQFAWMKDPESEGGEGLCDLTETWVKEICDRPDWCPLVEVPTPHGRLIDADELKIQVRVMNWGMKHYPDKFMDEVVHAPTIIEAEESE